MEKARENENRILLLENNYSHTMKQLGKIEKGIDDIKTELKCQREENDKKYASKNVEHIVYALVATILLAFLGALVTVVIN